jgi:glutamine cyclotransferase
MNVMQVLADHGVVGGKKFALPKNLNEEEQIVWEASLVRTYDFVNVDSEDNVYLTRGNPTDSEVKKFNAANGSVVWTVPLGFGVGTTCIGQDGFFYAFGSQKAAKINLTTGAKTEIIYSGVTLVSVYHATVDSSGNIYLSCQDDTYTYVKIVKFASNGAKQWLYSTGVVTSNQSTGAIVIGSNLYISAGSSVLKFTLTGSLIWMRAVYSLSGVIVDPLNSNYVLSFHNGVSRIDVSGSSDPVVLNTAQIPTNLGIQSVNNLKVINGFIYANKGSHWYKIRLSDFKLVGAWENTYGALREIASDSTFYQLDTSALKLRRVKFRYKIN